MDRGIDTRSPIAKKSAQPRLERLFFVYTTSFFCIALYILFLVLTHAPLTRIYTVSVSSGASIPAELIENYIHAQLTISSGLLPFMSVVSVPKKELEKKISEQFPFVKGVDISTPSIHTLYVKIIEEEYVHRYCDTDRCVGVSEGGRVLAPVPYFSSGVRIDGDMIPFMQRGIEDLQTRPTYGENILPGHMWKKIQDALINMKQNNIEVRNLTLYPLGFFVIQASVEENKSSTFEIRMRADEHTEDRMFELTLALQNGLRPRMNRESLEYIISYVPEKVIYRFKGTPTQ